MAYDKNDDAYLEHLEREILGMDAREELYAEIEKLRASNADLLAVLKEAVELIRIWHNMGIPDKDATWFHYQYSPEMRRINAAIARAEQVL